MMPRSRTYREFWPRYLGEHARAATRALHFAGTGLDPHVLIVIALTFLLAGAVAAGSWWLAVAALVCGYAFAWVGHAFVERNRPATFTHPWWSFVSDFRMFFAWLGGDLGGGLDGATSVGPDGGHGKPARREGRE